MTKFDVFGATATGVASVIALYVAAQMFRATTAERRALRAKRARREAERSGDALRWASLGNGYQFTLDTEGAADAAE